ncbi:hypothetical protein FRX31_032472 [Thalictrum thalictroides]|uniref:Uncharacterized protein n=1 Tax=Thalictrum thalictroides TaxID=46969 RepID=A0A7J6V0P3_THATH|nr:hypothetical protein FRX31_032472 [Thalictrum thalictroides]
MKNKYLENKSPKCIQLTLRSSKTWREIWACLEELVDISTWDFGPGNFSFGLENWMGIGCLSPNIVPRQCNLTLYEAVELEFNFSFLDREMQNDLQDAFHFLQSDSEID